MERVYWTKGQVSKTAESCMGFERTVGAAIEGPASPTRFLCGGAVEEEEKMKR